MPSARFNLKFESSSYWQIFKCHTVRSVSAFCQKSVFKNFVVGIDPAIAVRLDQKPPV